VLEIGTGCGYQTAVMAECCSHVYTIERIEELTARAARTLESLGCTNVSFLTGDGTLGWSEHAPFDGILAAAAAHRPPELLLRQLADGGRMVLPIETLGSQYLIRYEKKGQEMRQTQLYPVRFVPLISDTDQWS
jgi:protein-L-isoaspartate(D-aspartate) O-methyltransferase